MTPVPALGLIMIGVEVTAPKPRESLVEPTVGGNPVARWSSWVDNQSRRSHSHKIVLGGVTSAIFIHSFIHLSRKYLRAGTVLSWRHSSEHNR